MRGSIAGVVWGISALVQMGAIMVNVLGSFLKRNRVLLRLMGTSLVMASMTGGLALADLLLDSWVVSRLTLLLSVLSATLIGQELARRERSLGTLSFVLMVCGGLLAAVVWIPSISEWAVPATRVWVSLAVVCWAVAGAVFRPAVLVRRWEPILGIAMGLLVAWRFLPWGGALPVFASALVSWALLPLVARAVAPDVSGMDRGDSDYLSTLLGGTARVAFAFTPLVALDLLLPSTWNPVADVLVSALAFSFVLFVLPVRTTIQRIFEEDAAPVVKTLDVLTIRQQEVAALLAAGLTYAEIAARLFVSLETVKSHGKAIYRQLGVSGRRDLRRLISSSLSRQT